MTGFGKVNKNKNKNKRLDSFENKSNQKIDQLSHLSKDLILSKAFNCHSQGNISEAEKYYKYFLDKGYKDPRVFSNLGVIYQQIGLKDKAIDQYQKSIMSFPNSPEAYNNLGGLLNEIGKPKEAKYYLQKAIDFKSNYVDAYFNLATVFKDLEEFKEAEINFKKVIQLQPNYLEAYQNLAIILKKSDELNEAKRILKMAIALEPNYAIAYCNLGSILKDLGELEEAKLTTQKAIELKSDYPEPYLHLGNLFKDMNNLKQAEIYINMSISINQEYSDAYLALFSLYEQTNNLDKLQETLNRFNNIKSIKNELLLFQSRLAFRMKDFIKAKILIDKISNEWVDKTNIYNRLLYMNYKAFIEDKNKNYDIAFSFFMKSQLNPKYKLYNKNNFLKRIFCFKQSIIERDNFNYKPINYVCEKNIAFLIGFPRSGTTLLDTILRSHPQIDVAEEIPIISEIEKIVTNKFNYNIKDIFKLDENKLCDLRNYYFKRISQFSNEASNLIVDKLPFNTISLPLINLLFPKAKIIFAHRNPYDTVLSCFQQSFEPNSSMANLVSLESSAYIYNQVMEAWDIYRNSLSISYISSKYESLVLDFDQHINIILEFLELDWVDTLKDYRLTALHRGKINTPSSSQVVQPLYNSSIAKWKNYIKYFNNCHDYLDKWSLYFGY